MPLTQQLHAKLLSALLATVSFIACTPADPAVILKLEITEGSLYILDGAPVQREALPISIVNRKKSTKTLIIHVAASPKASSEAVIYATKAVGDAGAVLAFVGNEKY